MSVDALTRITFELNGTPTSQPRSRAFLCGRSIQMYDPAKDKKKRHQFEIIRLIKENFIDYKEAVEDFRRCENIRIEVIFEFMAPKSKKRLLGSLHNNKPDIDNLIKYVLDMGNGILWSDDRKINSLSAQKLYSKAPKTTINIWYHS